MEALKNLVDSLEYERLLKDVKQKLNLRIENDIPVILWSISSRELHSTSATPDELRALIKEEHDKLAAYVEKKLVKYKDDAEEEYPDGERPESEDGDEVVNLPFYKSFLIGYALEYWIMKKAIRARKTCA